jgi:hypothetical protein
MPRPFTGLIRNDLWRRWVLAFTLGEVLGFGGIPVLGGVIAFSLMSDLDPNARSLLLYAVAVLGGLGEGAVLGWFQARVLCKYLSRLVAGHWILATALAAAFAWACGMLTPTLDDLVGLPVAMSVALWIPAGLLILLSIGSAQAWILRRLVRQPRRWIAANALGWIAGLPWTFVLPGLLPEDSPPAAWVLVFIVAGILMGLTAGAVTGVFLVRLLPRKTTSD